MGDGVTAGGFEIASQPDVSDEIGAALWMYSCNRRSLRP